MNEQTINLLMQLLALGIKEAKRLSETRGKSIEQVLAEADLNWQEAGREADALLKLGHEGEKDA